VKVGALYHRLHTKAMALRCCVDLGELPMTYIEKKNREQGSRRGLPSDSCPHNDNGCWNGGAIEADGPPLQELSGAAVGWWMCC